MTITWANEKRRLGDLIPWTGNPRLIKKDEAARLVDSLDTFGQIETIAIDPTNLILDGHQREKVWGAAKQYGPDYLVDVRVASRPLTEKEHQKLVVYLHRGSLGEFDWEMLGNEFEVDELLEWGFKGYELGIPGGGNDPNAEWKGMPGYTTGNGPLDTALFITVRFLSQQDKDDFEKLVGQKGGAQKAIWYPKHDFDQNARGKKIVCES